MADSQRLAGAIRKYLMAAAGLLAAIIVIGPMAFGAFGAIGVGAVLFGAFLGIQILFDDMGQIYGVGEGPAWFITLAMVGGLAAVLTGVVGSITRGLAVRIALMLTTSLGDFLLDATYFFLFVALFSGLVLSTTPRGERILTALGLRTRPRESRTPTATGSTGFSTDEIISFIINSVSALLGWSIGVIIMIILFSGLGWLVGWLISQAVSGTSAPATGALVGGLCASLSGVGLIIGVTAGSILRLLMVVFGTIWPYLRMMFISTAGFITGYVVIVVLFAGYFAMVYRFDHGAFGEKPPESFGDFLFFSMMTMSTLGYSDLKPVSRLAQTVVSLEAVVSMGWTVVVFAAIIAYLDVHFISSLPVRQGNAYKAWVDSKPVQMVWDGD